MLDTNIRMKSEDLENIYETLDTVDYDANEEGIIKVGFRGQHKGLCKKMIYKKKKVSGTQSNKKTFQNQLSFYIRVFEEKEMSELSIASQNYDSETGKYTWTMKKGQTIFQYNGVSIETEDPHGDVCVFSSMNKKSSNVIKSKPGMYSGIVNANTLTLESSSRIRKISIHNVAEINMFVFTSGKIKVAGCTTENQVRRAMHHLVESFEKKWSVEETQKYLGVYARDFKIGRMDSVMINSDFKNSFHMNRYALDCLVRNKYGLMSTYEPCTHPAVIIKYYCNVAYETLGRCQCREHYNSAFMCKGRGDATSLGGCKSVTILVFQSGKVIITGGRLLEQVNEAYKYIKMILEENKSLIEYVERVEA